VSKHQAQGLPDPLGGPSSTAGPWSLAALVGNRHSGFPSTGFKLKALPVDQASNLLESFYNNVTLKIFGPPKA
jgi:hypothetical protein